MPNDLTVEQWSLLRWLSAEEYSQYGECHGANLDVLLERGLAKVVEDPAAQAGFIAQGRSKMFQAVTLTDAGLKLLKEGSHDQT